jgi:hypothetical protein
MKVIVNAGALFAGFLSQNSIVVYHIATVEYLKSQIAMKKKSADGDEGKQQLGELEAHLRTYEQKVQSFKSRNGPSSSKTITPWRRGRGAPEALWTEQKRWCDTGNDAGYKGRVLDE